MPVLGTASQAERTIAVDELASTVRGRIAPSPLVFDDRLPCKHEAGVPEGARWYAKCCTQAKLPVAGRGSPHFQRGSSRSASEYQSRGECGFAIT